MSAGGEKGSAAQLCWTRSNSERCSAATCITTMHGCDPIVKHHGESCTHALQTIARTGAAPHRNRSSSATGTGLGNGRCCLRIGQHTHSVQTGRQRLFTPLPLMLLQCKHTPAELGVLLCTAFSISTSRTGGRKPSVVASCSRRSRIAASQQLQPEKFAPLRLSAPRQRCPSALQWPVPAGRPL